jgi:hypothetical protein
LSVVLRPTAHSITIPKTPLVRTTIMEAELPPSSIYKAGGALALTN